MKRLCFSSVFVILMLSAALLVAHATAQPQSTPDRPDRERARLFLERRIESLEAEKARLQDAIVQIDAGAPLHEIRNSIALMERPDEGDFVMTPELRERALRVFEATNPELFKRWQELQARDPERAAQMRERITKRIENEGPLRDMMQLLERDPELFQLRAQQFALERRAYFAARRLVEATAQDNEDVASEARTELRSLLGDQLEARFAEQRKSMREAEERLGAMRQRLDEQSARRDELIEQRVEEIIRRVMDGPGDRGPWRGRPGADGKARPSSGFPGANPGMR